MKAYQKVLFGFAAVLAVVLTGCPSPVSNSGTVDMAYETSATIDTDRMVFIEEDGSEMPLLLPEEGGPEEVIDFAVLDDSDDSRCAGDCTGIRVVVIGRRSDGRSGIWVIYRNRGMMVLPNEDGIEDSELMELLEAESTPWIGPDWVYDAKAVSDDGVIIIGRLSRPDGWKYDEYLGDVPDPEIGVWWTLYEKEYTTRDGEVKKRLVVSRARPMILMEEPTPDESIARCGGHYRSRNWSWLEFIVEWLQSFILDRAWNFITDAESFVDPADVDGGIPDGFYVVTGPDKYGVASWAWLTATSMEDIVEAPETGDDNLPPYAVAGTTLGTLYYQYYSEDKNKGFLISEDPSGAWDPEGSPVTFDVVDLTSTDNLPEAWYGYFLDALTLSYDHDSGQCSIEIGNATPPSNDGLAYTATLAIAVTDEEGLTTSSSIDLVLQPFDG